MTKACNLQYAERPEQRQTPVWKDFLSLFIVAAGVAEKLATGGQRCGQRCTGRARVSHQQQLRRLMEHVSRLLVALFICLLRLQRHPGFCRMEKEDIVDGKMGRGGIEQ